MKERLLLGWLVGLCAGPLLACEKKAAPAEPPPIASTTPAAHTAACKSASECTRLAKELPIVGRAGHNLRLATYARLGCQGGDMEGCAVLARMYKYGTGVVKDLPRAVALYRKACHGKFPSGCFNAGLMVWHGLGIAKSDSRAERYFARGCAGGFGSACQFLAREYQLGQRLPKNLERAAHFLDLACKAGGLLATGACGKLKRLCEAGAYPACRSPRAPTK